MSDYTPAHDRRIFTGLCSNEECLTSMAIWPHWERLDDLPNQDEWDNTFLSCPVCDANMYMDWEDPMTPAIGTGYSKAELEQGNE